MKSSVVAVYTVCNKYGLYVDAVVVLARCQYKQGQYNDSINIHSIFITDYNRPAHLFAQSFRMKPNFQGLPWLSVTRLMK